MKRSATAVLTIGLTIAPAARGVGQAVPDDAQARQVDAGYRRPILMGFDPFRNVMIPRWGLVISTGASSRNNTLSLLDIGAVKFLDDRDSLTLGQAFDLLSLIPSGQGFSAATEADVGAHLGLSFGRRLTIGLSTGARVYGAGTVDDQAVSFVRDGNLTNQNFSLGASQGMVLGTADAGVHGVVRFGPIGSRDGVHVSAGFGMRLVRPVFMVDARSLIAGGGSFAVTGDSIRANVAVEIHASFPWDSTDNATDYLKDRAFGRVGTKTNNFMTDLLLRLEWPTSGIAVEGMVMNIGSPILIEELGRGADTLLIQTASLDSLREAFDALDFNIRDSVDLTVTLPRIWTVNASAWANRILQIDVGASGTLAGDIDIPLAVNLGTTWRFVRHLPLRAGVVLGGSQGIGYAGGVGIESRNFLLRVSGQSLGGLFRNATGVGARLDFGFFF